jgi:hypothetical protein
MLSSNEINGANGAFDSINGTIYLSKKFMAKNASSPQIIAKVPLYIQWLAYLTSVPTFV